MFASQKFITWKLIIFWIHTFFWFIFSFDLILLEIHNIFLPENQVRFSNWKLCFIRHRFWYWIFYDLKFQTKSSQLKISFNRRALKLVKIANNLKVCLLCSWLDQMILLLSFLCNWEEAFYSIILLTSFFLLQIVIVVVVDSNGSNSKVIIIIITVIITFITLSLPCWNAP